MSAVTYASLWEHASRPLFAAAIYAAYKYLGGKASMKDAVMSLDTLELGGAVLGSGLLFSELIPYVSNATGADLAAQKGIVDPVMTGVLFAAMKYGIHSERDMQSILNNAFLGATADVWAHTLSAPVSLAIRSAGVAMPKPAPRATTMLIH